ncbi:MAG: Gx transporter family protein [Clostridia bacterium]|nr:Gx transporter family protein [Clostridia bacterium]
MNNRNRIIKSVPVYSMLIALALILSYVEAQFPPFFAVPGMKLGLTNTVVLITLYLKDSRSAVFINIVRILIVSILFGNGLSFVYSMSGGLLSGAVMILLKKTNRFSITAVSTVGGVAHNVGQILAAMLIMSTSAIAWYMTVLWISGMASGALIGFIGGILCKKLKKYA